jgi:hypothetical protein
MDITKLSSDEKLDLILKYQKSQRFWSIVRAIVSLSVFIVFIVIPIVWTVMFVKEHLAGVDFTQISQAMENLKGIDINQVNKSLESVGNLLGN